MKDNFIAVLLVAVAFGVGFMFSSITEAPTLSGGSIQVNQGAFGAASTSTNITVNTTSTIVLRLNQERSYARITNASNTRIWCEASTIGATSTEGFLLSPVGSSTGSIYLEIGANAVPSYGSIFCISDVAISAVGVVEN